MKLTPIRDAVRQAAAKYLVAPGNIDLGNRPVVLNDDGSFSTEESMSYQDDAGNEVLIPTVINGQHAPSEDAAIAYAEHSGQNLGKFTTPEAADNYAEALHLAQERKYSTVAAAMMEAARLRRARTGQ
jgi:hypothetical protein